MLNSITLLCAVDGIREDHVLDTIKALRLMDNQPYHGYKSRKMWHIVLIAAIIAALLTACAVGYTIHQRRQIELKAALQIESNSVEGYTEYTETDAGTGQANKTAASDIAPHIQLISSIQQGENQLVYFSVAPVTEEEAHSYIYDSFVTAFVSLASNKPIPEAYWMNDSERGKDSSKNFADPAMIMLAANTDTKEAAITTTAIDPEQTKAAIMSRCYDAETQSLMLQSYVNRNNVDFSMPVYFSVRCLDFESMRIPGEDYTVTEHPTAFELGDPVYSHDYGTIILRGEETVFVSVNFASPIALYDETTGGQCKVLSVRLSANCAEWRLRHDDICANPVEWYAFYDELMNSAYLTFEDGSTIKMTRSPWADYEGNAVILFTEWPGTIDITKVAQINIMGQKYSIS